ncbi:hypothetical protein [Kitasatospora sp. NPDC089509]|uniref:hypothetical protein n=1 Tax=Kitasatospora sp. NPDC089509 TaxID=3364079 RepID=UPI00381B592F
MPVRVGVAVDPNGGGRDTAGIVGGHLGDDGRLYWTHDRTKRCGPAEWSRRACELAELASDFIVVELNYGRAIATLAVRTAWNALRRKFADERPGRRTRTPTCPRASSAGR